MVAVRHQTLRWLRVEARGAVGETSGLSSGSAGADNLPFRDVPRPVLASTLFMPSRDRSPITVDDDVVGQVRPSGQKLPSGLVTFLFTDIEGSTRLHHRLGERFETLISTHDWVLREAVERHGGVVVNSLGDGLFAAFPDATSAIDAAVDGQLALAAADWDGESAPAVRMGLHCGQAQPRDVDYVALPVHQAARVAAAAYGGQVLGTPEVVDAAPCPVGAAWRDLGAYRLKGFDQPVRLVELQVDGLARDFAGSTRATPAAAHNVPDVPTSFVGRDTEIAELSDLITGSSRVITLLGPGGVGKTRLAFETVKSVAPSFRDGAWVALLANASAGAEVADRLLRALRIPDRPPATARQTLIFALADRHTLLLLDNTEHVTDQTADLIREVIAACPDVKVLVTSRQPLGLSAEVEWRLAPLAVTAADGRTAAAVELFEQRALARNRKLNVDREGRAVIEHICRQVDGLPLAVELAAGRLRHMKLSDLAARLHERLQLAAVADRDLDPRQRTLHALVDWSYQLLTPQAQAMLRRMSVLQAPAPLDGIEIITGISDDTGERLAELVDKSLVSFDSDDERPYRMLVTIRDYAQRRLADSEEERAIRRRHLQYHVEFVHRVKAGLNGSDPAKWLAEADRSYDDFTAALAFAQRDGDADSQGRLAATLWHYAWHGGRLASAHAWLAAAAEVPCAPHIRAEVLRALGLLLVTRGDAEGARACCEQAVELAHGFGDGDLLALALMTLSQVHQLSGEYKVAQNQLERGLGVVTSAEVRAHLMFEVAIVSHWQGDYATAIRGYREAESAFRSVGIVIKRPIILGDLGEALVDAGRLEEAEPVLTEALALAETIARSYVPQIHNYLAKLHLARGDTDRARAYATFAVQLAREAGNAFVLNSIASLGLADDDTLDSASGHVPLCAQTDVVQ